MQGNSRESMWVAVARLGGWAALLAALIFRRNWAAEYHLLHSMGLFAAGPDAPPVDAAGWFSLLNQQPLIGLVLFDFVDMINALLVGLMIAGLYVALRRALPGWMTRMLTLGLLAVLLYLISNQSLQMLVLAGRYAAAGPDQQAGLIVEGQAVIARHLQLASFSGGPFPSYLLMNLSLLGCAAAMLRSQVFSPITGWIGVIAALLCLGYYPAAFFAPEWIVLPVAGSAIPLMIWYILIGVRLVKSGATEEPAGA